MRRNKIPFHKSDLTYFLGRPWALWAFKSHHSIRDHHRRPKGRAKITVYQRQWDTPQVGLRLHLLVLEIRGSIISWYMPPGNKEFWMLIRPGNNMGPLLAGIDRCWPGGYLPLDIAL
jgi:hypothetical protein